jgi:hypothetical protein
MNLRKFHRPPPPPHTHTLKIYIPHESVLLQTLSRFFMCPVSTTVPQRNFSVIPVTSLQPQSTTISPNKRKPNRSQSLGSPTNAYSCRTAFITCLVSMQRHEELSYTNLVRIYTRKTIIWIFGCVERKADLRTHGFYTVRESTWYYFLCTNSITHLFGIIVVVRVVGLWAHDCAIAHSAALGQQFVWTTLKQEN